MSLNIELQLNNIRASQKQRELRLEEDQLRKSTRA